MDEMIQSGAFAMQSRLVTNEGPIYNDQVRLLYCLSNQVIVTIDEVRYQLHAGNIIVINEGRYYQLQADTSALVCSIMIDPKTFRQTIKTDLFFVWLDPNVEDDKHVVILKSLLNELIFYDMQLKGADDFFKYSIYFKIMDFLVKHYLHQMDEANGYTNQDIRAQQIRTYIRDHYMQRLTLTQLSQELYISEGYLSRFFKKELKRGFLAYLNDVRLYHTIDALLNTETNITDIAMANGFNSISGFNQLFKKQYGLSPKAYRKSHKQSKQSLAAENAQIQNQTILFLKQHQDDLPQINKHEHTIQIDARQSTTFQKNWANIINIGNVESLLEQRTQTAAMDLHNELGFKYLRMWSVFDAVEIAHDQINFDKLDSVLDFVINHDMKPFLVIGPKPHVLTIDTENKPVNKQTQDAALAQQDEAWQRVLTQWLKHIKFRYGAKELADWMIELWKPNRWDNVYSSNFLDDWYLDWLTSTITLLQAKVPEIKLGGCEFVIEDSPATKLENDRIIEKWHELNFTPDFISISDYPYEKTELSTRLDQLEYYVSAARDVFDQKYPGVALYVTEWNLTVSNRNILNDTTFKGAYMIQNLTNDLENADQTAYWLASDSYSEYTDSSDTVFGASGLLTKSRIRKPAFYAFDFLNALMPYKLYGDVNCFVSTDREDAYTILLFCAKPFNSLYYSNNGHMTRDNYSNAFLDLEAVDISITLSNTTHDNYEIRTQTVNNDYGSVLDLWKQLGYMGHLRVEDERYLKSMSVPHLTIEQLSAKSEVLELKQSVAANTFQLITLTPIG